MATILIPDLRSDLRAGCNSSSRTTKSPSTTALSSAPAKAAQVLTPISLPTSQPQGILTMRPKTALNMPSFVSPFVPKRLWSGSDEIELLAGRPDGLKLWAGCESAARIFLTVSSAARTPLASVAVLFAADVHEIDFGFVKKEVVVQRSDLKPVFEGCAHNGVDFILHQDEVAHDHCPVLHPRHKRRPGGKPHERRHFPFVHGDFNVRAGRGNLVNAFLLIKFAVEAGEFVNLSGIQIFGLSGGCGDSKKPCKSDF